MSLALGLADDMSIDVGCYLGMLRKIEYTEESLEMRTSFSAGHTFVGGNDQLRPNHWRLLGIRDLGSSFCCGLFMRGMEWRWLCVRRFLLSMMNLVTDLIS
jgi:hypothetical protein